MKSWQDRGEVLDSDDEDLSLGTESQSPERPRKKQKISVNGRPSQYNASEAKSPGLGGVQQDEGEEEGWLRRPPATTTYGKKTKLVKPANAVAADDASIWRDSDRDTTTNSATISPQHSRIINGPDIDEERNVSRALDLDNLSDAPRSSANGKEDAPSNDVDLSTAPSSPLSEREVSPTPPPTGFRFPRLGHAAPETEAHPGDDDDQDDDDRMSAGVTDLDAVTAGLVGRRNMRTRKEKQLHPYMFDKAQYQRQCRERGMRPVRYMEAEQKAAETQDAAPNGDDSQSQLFNNERGSSPARPNSVLQEDSLSQNNHVESSLIVDDGNRESDSDNELPDLQNVIGRPATGGVRHVVKRRKLLHIDLQSRSMTTYERQSSHKEQQEEFSVPLSPPPTSSNSIRGHQTKVGEGGFRLPRGLSPAPLPTPQISSDVRNRHVDGIGDVSDDELPRTSRPSTLSRIRQRVLDVQSSTESSGSEREPEVNEQRLQRERKRIRGVLPASWLKIDLRAQQKRPSPSPERRRRLSSASPPRTMHQKGVAQITTSRRSFSPNRAGVVATPVDDSETNSRMSSPSPPKIRQPPFSSDREEGTLAPSEFVDIDEMELNWIDPMFAASSRRSKPSTKRQPKIKDAFDSARRNRTDFSEERTARRNATRAETNRPPREEKGVRKWRKAPPAAHNLSILDAPGQSSTQSQAIPQFVRVAMRNARTRGNHGRHSPTRKHFRLATREDTEEATVVFKAWREGTIAPRQDVLATRRYDGTNDSAFEGQTGPTETLRDSRTPLRAISGNSQRTLPTPLRNETKAKRVTHASTTVRRPRLQQTRLQPAASTSIHAPHEQHKAQLAQNTPVAARGRLQRLPRSKAQPNRYRGAQLESLEDDFDRQHRTAAFERRMQLLTENVALRPRMHGSAGFRMARFLHDPGANMEHNQDMAPAVSTSAGDRRRNLEIPAPDAVLPRRTRKRQTHRVDVEAREYRQPSEPLPDVVDLDKVEEDTDTSTAPVLQGLGPFGTKYATDFDMLPLSLGTFFHESTFIGSGDFAASLSFANRNLDIPTGRISIHVDGDVLEWGAWTEDVAVGLGRIPPAISHAIHSLDGSIDSFEAKETASLVLLNIDYLLRSTVRYFTRCLAFLDSIDRRSGIERLQSFIEDLLEVTDEAKSIGDSSNEVHVRCLQYVLVLARQALGLCDHPLVQPELKTRCVTMARRVASLTARHVLPNGLRDLRTFYEDNKRASKRESGIRDSDTSVCTTLILHHVLQDAAIAQSTFWNVVYKAFEVTVAALNTVSEVDTVWYNVFALLPILEIDAHGIARIGSRLKTSQEDWSLIKHLVERVFHLYSATSFVHGSTINDYVRAMLVRCYRLINTWGWWRCESILGAVFDFFARRGLAQLHKEEIRGSPKFLEGLDHQPSLEVQAEDRSFHIFLKLLASALQGMQKHTIYPNKTIGGIAWRFIPNHGRTYRKDVEVRQEDLDALRNHHDLLSTLYYASPPAHRLRVELVQNLVDHSASHREACRLNIRAWANLACFQMSTGESTERLSPFVVWYRETLTTTSTQYLLARTEVEQDVAAAHAQGNPPVSEGIVEDTIARNQRQISATLVDCLAALKRALQVSSSLDHALVLLNGSSFWHVFDLHDPYARRLNTVLNEALEVIKTALNVQNKFQTSSDSQSGSDDSQDYGDSTALQALASSQVPVPSSDRCISDVLHGPVSYLISNIFGADTASDDALLVKLLDVWTHLAQGMVQAGRKCWTNYINDYSSESWSQLRDTEQRRKYTPYFLARVVETSKVDISEVAVLSTWLKSLVEREAVLKFQHELTNALLNQYSEERLLQDLPIVRQASGNFNISLHELRQRRLSILSSVFSNMRESCDAAMHETPHLLQGLRRTYSDMLKQLMQAMKSHYQQVGTHRDENVADVYTLGAYVEFVQQVVSFMQQYTTDICQVDRFFTDSAAFPLPAADPSYVVGRLRAYVPKLSEVRKRKELVVFIHAVSERAAVDSQQAYLVDQLVVAMSGVLERGDPKAPSLRHVLMTAILPAYIEHALSTACLWIPAKTVLKACGPTANGLLYNVKLEDHRSVKAVEDTLSALLHSMIAAIRIALTRPHLMALSYGRSTLAEMFCTAQQCMTPICHLERVTRTAGHLIDLLAQLIAYAGQIESYFSGVDELDLSGPVRNEIDAASLWPETLEFSRKQVQERFASDWRANDDGYYVRRGNGWVEVAVGLVDEDEERVRLLKTLREFRQSYEAIFHGRDTVLRPVNHKFGVLVV